MEPSLDPLPFVPKRVTNAQQPQLWPDRTLPSHGTVQPLWGHGVRVVVRGGPWDLSEEPEILRDAEGRPRSRDSRPSGYEAGEYDWEPDPAISSKAKTGAIVRAMWRAGWTRDQANHVLMAHARTGGAYYRWRTDSEDFMDHLWTHTATTERDPHYRRPPRDSLTHTGGICNSGSRHLGTAITNTPPRDSWQYAPQMGDRVLRCMSRLPPLNQGDLCVALVTEVDGVHPRNVRKYLTHLQGQGLLSCERVRTPGKPGKPAKVWKIAESVLSATGVDLVELLTAPEHKETA